MLKYPDDMIFSAVFFKPRKMYEWVIMMRESFIGVNNFRDIRRSRINEGKQ